MPKTDAAIERKIMELVQTHSMFHGVNIIVADKAGALHNRNTLDHPSDVLFLKRRVAEIEGVIDINILAKFIA